MYARTGLSMLKMSVHTRQEARSARTLRNRRHAKSHGAYRGGGALDQCCDPSPEEPHSAPFQHREHCSKGAHGSMMSNQRPRVAMQLTSGRLSLSINTPARSMQRGVLCFPGPSGDGAGMTPGPPHCLQPPLSLGATRQIPSSLL